MKPLNQPVTVVVHAGPGWQIPLKIETTMSERSPDNILFYLPEDQEQQVRDIFARLNDLGLPLQHQRPHITVTFAPDMSAEVVARAAEVLPPVVPATFKRVGTVIFGTRSKQTIAWLLETNDEVVQAAREICAVNPDGRGTEWIPHLTMGLRVPRAVVPDFMRGLDQVTPTRFKELTALRAAYWKPKTQEYTHLAGPEPA